MSTTLRPRTVKATSTRDSTRDKNQDKEIHRRISAGWTAFAKHPENFKGNIGTCLKRQVYNLCVLPAMTYGAETWALTTQAKKQASSRTNKDGKECVKHHIQGQKNKHLGKGKDTVTHTWLNKSQGGSGHGQRTSAGYELTHGHCVSHLETLRKENT